MGHSLGVLYADDEILGYRDPGFLQGVLNIHIGLLRQIGLVDNAAKSKTMTCQPGEIRSVILKEEFGRHRTGEGYI